MHKDCGQCGSGFEIADEDKAFFVKVSPEFNGKKYEILPPTLCPDCRQQRRLVLRNERNFYKRKCDLTGKDMISVYSPDFKGKVYSQSAFWSDDWDGRDYGRDFDFDRPFFEQYNELSLEAPRVCLVNFSNENSRYNNHAAFNKNCYMCMNTGWSEDCLHSSNYNLYNKNCVDCLAIQNCELCYFCTDTRKSFSSMFLYECENLSDCFYCYDCQSCQDCFGCWNLRHKKYCLYNKQLTKEEYEAQVPKMKGKTWAENISEFEKFKRNMREDAIHKNVMMEKSTESSGDHIWNSKKVKDSYYVFGSEDSKYCYDAGNLKDCYDAYEPFKGELEYETHACNMGYQYIVGSKCYENDNLYYSQYCWNSSNVFGCIGLKKQKYCVMNKQYTKEAYEELVPRIIEHMIGTGEWGEFFPTKNSPFAYEETVANDYYPQGGSSDIGEKPFNIVSAEKKFYEKMGLPEPELHPDERFKMRMDLRNTRKLRKTECGDCGCEVETTYPEGKVKKIYCEECYNKAIYG